MQLRLRASFSFSFLTLALIPLLSACPSDDDGDGEEEVGETVGTEESGTEEESGTDESGTDESTSDESTSDESTEDTGTEESGTDESTEDTTEESTDDTGTEETDTGTETTGDPSLNEQLCMDGCAVFVECLGGGGLPECFDNCLEYHDSLDGECLGFEQALTGCIAGLTCNELDQFLEEFPEPYPCQAEQEQVCDVPLCQAGVGGGENPGECSFEYSCPDEPVYEVVCDGESCTCLEDGVEVGGCSEAIDFCAEVGELGPASACCGWDL